MNPKRRKLSGQLFAVPVENDPVPAAGNRTGDIDGGIIDENTLPGHEAEFVRKRLINLAHGLDKTDIAGNQFSVKEGAGRDFRPVDMLCLAGIAEQLGGLTSYAEDGAHAPSDGPERGRGPGVRPFPP